MLWVLISGCCAEYGPLKQTTLFVCFKNHLNEIKKNPTASNPVRMSKETEMSSTAGGILPERTMRVALCCTNAHCSLCIRCGPFWPSVCFRLCSTHRCNRPRFDYKESLSPARFLSPFVLGVPPQCSVALWIPPCVSPLPITISCLL